MRFFYFLIIIPSVFFICSCITSAKNNTEFKTSFEDISVQHSIDSSYKTIHVFVALCDNKYQGIVPVPAKIGNGQDIKNNLYWSTAYGVKTFFKNSKEWKLIRTQAIDSMLLERIIFKHQTKKYYLVADAYNGKNIKQCTIEFLKSCAVQHVDTVQINNKTIGINGYSNLLAYIGHDGLMDFKLENSFQNKTEIHKDAIVLACISKKYFAPFLNSCKANPLVWSTGLMSPEAYTLHDALSGYINQESTNKITEKAAMAYSKYQKCSLSAAKKLLVNGW
jgi:hypothetical protein